MRLYLRNVFRSAFKNKGTFIGAISVIALGILIYISMTDVMLNLKDKVDLYYKEYNFADVFATVNEMPSEQLKKLENIEGIHVASGRLSKDVRIYQENGTEVVMLHVLAYDENSKLNLMETDTNNGEMSDNTILIGKKMYDAYKFGPNTQLELIFGKRTETFSLGGTVKAPEYIFTMTPTGLPDSETYDIACINKKRLEQLTGKEGMVTELGFTLDPGYTYSDVKYELEQKLKPYGLFSLQERKDQTSNYMLNSEMSQLKGMATTLPIVFLVISIFMLYIVLKKLIDGDRCLIGTMKAYGFTDGQMISAYLRQGVFIGIVGGVLGGILAIPLSQFTYSMYAGIYNLPYNDFTLYARTRIIGVLIGVVTSIAACYLGAKGIVTINPAESMRSAAPTQSVKFKLPEFLNKRFDSKVKMSIRSVFRHKFRSLVIAFAIAFPFSFTSVMSGVLATSNNMVMDQFTNVSTYDFVVVMNDSTSMANAMSSLRALKYAYDVEANGGFSVEIKNGNLTKRTSINAQLPNSLNNQIRDLAGRFYTPSKDGLIMDSSLAKKLNVSAGDVVEVSSKNLAPKPVKMVVLNVIDQSFGGGCYINIEALDKYFNVSQPVNTLMFKAEPGKSELIKKELLKSKTIAAVIDIERTLKNYKELMKNSTMFMKIFEFLSILAGLILIYNIFGISIRERKNEFGTLTVLGTSFKEIAYIISMEQIMNFFAGITLGVPLTLFFKGLVESLVSGESYTIKILIPFHTYLYSLSICALIMVLSLAAILRHVKKIETVDVLKERE